MAPRLVIVFPATRDSHLARVEAFCRRSKYDVTVIQARNQSYGVTLAEAATGYSFRGISIAGERGARLSPRGLWAAVAAQLDALQPQRVAVAGWSEPGSLAALCWAKRNGVPVVLMSESNRHDKPRNKGTEFVKSLIVRVADAAFVGGSNAADYLTQLGIDRSAIYKGFNVVDNHAFGRAAERVRAADGAAAPAEDGPAHFLAVGRFAAKKNYKRLLEAYRAYVAALAEPPLKLRIIGDGDQRRELETFVQEHGLGDCVELLGELDPASICREYARAACLVHAATRDQWAMVVNEAMAAGLPVLVSNRAGCARDLVHEGENGFTFDPDDTEDIAHKLQRFHALRTDAALMGRKSAEIIANWSPQHFAEGLSRALEHAGRAGKPELGVLPRVVMRALCTVQDWQWRRGRKRAE